MIKRGVITKVENFDRAQLFTSTPGESGWTLADTSAVGSPTALCITENGGAAKLTLAATSEAENLCLFMNDVLPIDLANLQFVSFVVAVEGIDAVTSLVVGVGTARNDTPDSVTVNAWAKIDGTVSTTNLVVETDDNVTDVDDVATSTTLAAVYKEIKIVFTSGLSDIRFFIDGERVAAATTFSLNGITAGQNVQPIIQLQKASGTGVPSVTIVQVTTQQRYAYGA